jgi:hypothetical protein
VKVVEEVGRFLNGGLNKYNEWLPHQKCGSNIPMKIPPHHRTQDTSLHSLYRILPQQSHGQFQSNLPPIQQIENNQVCAWGQGLRKELDNNNGIKEMNIHIAIR